MLRSPRGSQRFADFDGNRAIDLFDTTAFLRLLDANWNDEIER